MNIVILSAQAEADQSSFQLINSYAWHNEFSYSRNAGAYKIAAEMRNLGHNVEVLDFIVYWPEEAIKKYFEERADQIDVVAWSSQFFFRHSFYLEYCDYIKELNPNITIITGGPKVANLLNFTKSKYLIAGYAETAIVDVLNHIEKKPNKLKFQIVNGQYYVDCLKHYTMIELPPLETKYHPSDYIIPSETLTLSTSRGCIFKCDFCTYPYIGKKKGEFTRMGAETYYNELMQNYIQWGTTNYYLADETANDLIDKLMDLEEAAKMLPFKLDITGFARLDLLIKQEPHWALFKNIGFTNWHLGVETFSPTSLKAISKPYSPVKLQQALIKIREYFPEANMTASFILGAPYDSPELFEKHTISWLTGTGKGVLSGISIFALNVPRETPYAVGSEISKNFRNYGYNEMTADEIAHEMKLHPSITMSTVEETSKYNVLWSTPDWNVISTETYSREITKTALQPNNISCWTRSRAINVGITPQEIKQLVNPNNQPLSKLIRQKVDECRNAYINKKLAHNWFHVL
jgi:hypothetical protein